MEAIVQALEQSFMKQVPVDARWQARPETPEQLAQRLRTLLRLLRPISPPFRRWLHAIDETTFRPVDEHSSDLAPDIAADIHIDEMGLPSPYFGYGPRLINTSPDAIGPDSLFMHLKGGGKAINSLRIESMCYFGANPELVSFPILRRIVLAISEAFEPDHCDAGPLSLYHDMDRSAYKGSPIIPPTWMIQLSPLLAKHVEPPPDIIAERRADDSLFLAATDQPFSIDNPEHVAAARRLHAAIDPLHDIVPFNGRMRR